MGLSKMNIIYNLASILCYCMALLTALSVFNLAPVLTNWYLDPVMRLIGSSTENTNARVIIYLIVILTISFALQYLGKYLESLA